MAFEVFKMVGTIAINREQALRDIQVIKQSVDKTSKEMQGSLQKFTTAHSASFKKMGMIAMAAGAVISLAIKKVGSSFDIYETALVDMGKITDESFKSIENRMKKLPPILGSLTELTRGYYQIVSAGIRDPVLAVETLIVAAETAAAAHINQSDVVKGLTKVMAGYEGKIKDVSEAADLMFAIEKEGQTTVAEMIPLIGGLASVSSNLGISQDEMGASMAVITRTAGNSAAAATMYEGVLLGLMKPTESMTTALNNLGKNYDGVGFASAQAAIEELGFVEVLKRLDEATGGSAEVLAELFGRKQAIMGMTKLTTQEMGPLSDAIDSVVDKAGMADKAFQDWTTTGDAFNKEQKAVTENLLILIGKAIDPMMDVIQRRLIKTITIMGEWIDKNEEMAASIAMWTGGIGMALVPLGLLAMTFPGLVLMADKLIILWPKIGIATGLLSAKFALLAAGIGLSTGGLTLLLAGLTAIGLYIGNEWKKAWEEGQRIKEMEIKSNEAQIEALEKLKKAYNMTDEELQYWIDNGKISASVMTRMREETRLLGEAKYGLADDIMGVVKAVKEETKSFEELDVAILNSIIAGKELSEEEEAYMVLRQQMTDIGKTATQKKLDDLKRESIALIANMSTNLMTMEQIDEYRKVMRQHIIAESSEREEHLRNMEDIETKLFELTHTQTEARIRDLELERDALIETAESSYLLYDKQEEAIAEIIKWYDLEKEAILEKREEYVTYLDAMKSIEDRMFEVTHTQREIEIRDLDRKKAKLIDIATQAGVSATEEIVAIKKIVDWYKKEIALLQQKEGIISGKRYNIFDKYGANIASVGSGKAQEMLEMGYDVMEIPSNTPVQQQGTILGEIPTQMEQGGAIKSFVNVAKFLARGGPTGTDTVPIWATPGEYVVKKSMVDFIQRTGMVTGGLVEAIKKGLPTPSPAFAGGGMVWGSSRGGISSVGGEPSSVIGKSGSWTYSINFVNPIIRSEEDLVRIKELMEEVLVENADSLDLSGNEIGV